MIDIALPHTDTPYPVMPSRAQGVPSRLAVTVSRIEIAWVGPVMRYWCGGRFAAVI